MAKQFLLLLNRLQEVQHDLCLVDVVTEILEWLISDRDSNLLQSIFRETKIVAGRIQTSDMSFDSSMIETTRLYARLYADYIFAGIMLPPNKCIDYLAWLEYLRR